MTIAVLIIFRVWLYSPDSRAAVDIYGAVVVGVTNRQVSVKQKTKFSLSMITFKNRVYPFKRRTLPENRILSHKLPYFPKFLRSSPEFPVKSLAFNVFFISTV